MRPRLRLYLLLLVVAGAAAMLSFATLRDLGLTAGFHPGLAWMLPITIDTGAALGAMTWLGDNSPQVQRVGKRLTWSLLALSIVGNATQHALTTPPDLWLYVVLVVLVSAVPPAVLGAVVHLHVITGRELAAAKQAKSEAAVEHESGAAMPTPMAVIEEVAEEVGLPFAPLTPRQTTCHVYRLYDAEGALLYVGVGFDVAARCRKHKRKKDWWSEVVNGSIATYPTRRDALLAEQVAIADEEPRHNIMPGGESDHATAQSDPDWTPSDPVATRENIPAVEMHAPVRGDAVEDDSTLADRVVAWADEEGSMPSRERVRLRFNVGSKRAERVRLLAVEQQWAAQSDPSPDHLDLSQTPAEVVGGEATG